MTKQKENLVADIDSTGNTSPPGSGSSAEAEMPLISRMAILILKLGVIGLVCWSGWFALSVFSGFSKPIEQMTEQISRKRGESKESAGSRSQAASQIALNEPIMSIPLHQLLQGQWRLSEADWTVNMRALPGDDPGMIESELLRPPSTKNSFTASSELQQLLDLARTYTTSVTADKTFVKTRIKSDQFDAIVFADVRDASRIFFVRAVSRLTSEKPMLIEISPGGFEKQEATVVSIVEFENPLFPDDSFVVTDQIERTTSLIVTPVARHDLIQFWIKSGWQVHELEPAPGIPVYLRGVRDHVRVEFIDQSETHTSIVARRITPGR